MVSWFCVGTLICFVLRGHVKEGNGERRDKEGRRGSSKAVGSIWGSNCVCVLFRFSCHWLLVTTVVRVNLPVIPLESMLAKLSATIDTFFVYFDLTLIKKAAGDLRGADVIDAKCLEGVDVPPDKQRLLSALAESFCCFASACGGVHGWHTGCIGVKDEDNNIGKPIGDIIWI